MVHTWAAIEFSLSLIQCFQHVLSQVFVFANDCVAVPDVHHLLDAEKITQIVKKQDDNIYFLRVIIKSSL